MKILHVESLYNLEWISFKTEDGREGRLFFDNETKQYMLTVDYDTLSSAKQTDGCVPYIDIQGFRSDID